MARHITQELVEFRMDWAGKDGVKVFERHMETIAGKWLQARVWMKDMEESRTGTCWRHICQVAIDAARGEMKAAVKAVEYYRTKGEEDLMKESEAKAARIEKNLEVHFKESLWLKTPHAGEDFAGLIVEESKAKILEGKNSLFN